MRFETGELENYNSDKGFGFVFLKDHYRDKSVFLHISNVKNIKSQLDTPNLKLWVEVGMNNKNQNYVNRAWTSRDELPKEYLKIVEDC